MTFDGAGGAAGPRRTDTAVVAVAAVLVVVSALSPALGGLAPPALAVRSLSGAVFIAAGAIAWRRGAPRRVGWLFVLAGCASCAINLGLWDVPWVAVLRLATGGYTWFGCVFAHLLLTYPTGRTENRSERVAIACLYAASATTVLNQLLVGDSAGRRDCLPDGCPGVFAPPVSSDAAVAFQRWSLLVLVPTASALVLVVLLRRVRRADPAHRRALRPVVVSAVAGMGLGATTVLARVLGWHQHDATRVAIALVWGVGVAALAVYLLVHVLRSRLVVYGMGELVSGFDATTPLARTQVVLRRLLGDPTAQLLVVDEHGEQDASGRADEHGLRFRDVRGRAAVADAGDRRRHLIGSPPAGALLLDAAAPVDRQVLDAVLGALTLLVGNLRLQDQLQERLHEVRASRARLVEAADVERRRIERDLHDGAQQYLVVSALNVRLAQSHLPEDPVRADDHLERAGEQLTAAVRALRDLVHGLHAAVLDEEGIGAAAGSLGRRLQLDLTISDETDRRYPPALESTACFVIAEALVNVVKHAGTTTAAVRLHEAGGHLVVDVSDRGRGGADPAGGTGLQGLADRVAALGGSSSLTAADGGGTHLRVRLPAPAAVGAPVED